MKALVIVPDVVPYGGTSRFLERLLEIHVRQVIVTTLLVPTNQSHTLLVSLAERYRVQIVQSPNRSVSDTPPFMTPLFDFLFSWRTVCSCRPDLIVVSTSDPGRMSVALYYPFPVLYILHSVPEHRFRFLPKCYLRLGMLLNNMLMTVSKAAAEAISHVMGIPKEEIAVVHNSCRSVKLAADIRQPVVLTVGHVVPYKNPAGWLAVAQMVIKARPEVFFVWVGDGELYDSMRAQIIALGLKDRIKFTGFYANPSTWYEKSQFYFQPSLRESHGIAVLEAMANGLPCVVADTGGLPESVVDGETGYVCSNADPAAFAKRIIELLDDPALRERMGAAGRRRVKKCFSEEIQEQKIMALYERLKKR